ncbi:hypothetical protein, partial [Oenococcus oeni]
LDDLTYSDLRNQDLLNRLMPATDERLFMVADLLRRGITIGQIHEKSQIDEFFLDKILHLIEIEKELK